MSRTKEYLVVDSSVFISALGQNDKFSTKSRQFLLQTSKHQEIVFLLPSIVVAEVIVNLRKQKGPSIKKILDSLLKYKIVPLDTYFLEHFYAQTRNPSLKTSDLIIAGTAKMHDATLISWDKKHLSKDQKVCSAMSPETYIKSR